VVWGEQGKYPDVIVEIFSEALLIWDMNLLVWDF
jgi:Uma2 family endonuclease